MQSVNHINNGTASCITRGSLQNVGSITFSSDSDIRTLFASRWDIVSMQRRDSVDYLHIDSDIHSEWHVVAAKSP